MSYKPPRAAERREPDHWDLMPAYYRELRRRGEYEAAERLASGLLALCDD